MKTIITSLFIIMASTCTAQNVELMPRNEVKYKTVNPDSAALPVTKEQLLLLCSALSSSTDNRTAENMGNLFWNALKNPLQFDAKLQTPFSFAGEDSKPVLTLWTESKTVKGFARALFIQRFFGSCFNFSRPDTIDVYINDKLRHIKEDLGLDTSIINPYARFNGSVKKRLTTLKQEIQPRGWSFLFLTKGSYYGDQYAGLIVRTVNVTAVEKILAGMNMKTISWEKLMR